jgi:hypothetical protein
VKRAPLTRSRPLLPCGPGWDTREAAQADGQDGAVIEQCPDSRCGKFHAGTRVRARAPRPARVALPALPALPVPRRRDTGPDKETRLAVYERDGWACACCGLSVIGLPHSVGHRKRRSQGGTNDPSNLLTFLGFGNGLTADDHHWRIDRREKPLDEKRGYTVRSWQDPALVPVTYMSSPADEDGVRYWLTDDAGRATEAPEGAGAA